MYFAGNIRGAVTVCNEENTPMSRMLVKGLLHYRLPVTELRAIVESAANLEVAGMEKDYPLWQPVPEWHR